MSTVSISFWCNSASHSRTTRFVAYPVNQPDLGGEGDHGEHKAHTVEPHGAHAASIGGLNRRNIIFHPKKENGSGHEKSSKTNHVEEDGLRCSDNLMMLIPPYPPSKEKATTGTQASKGPSSDPRRLCNVQVGDRGRKIEIKRACIKDGHWK